MRYLLIMLWIGGLLLGLGQAVRAQTPSEKQRTEMHTVRIAAHAPVFVSVMLDGRLVLNATLQPGEWRTWHGEQFELKASNASALEVTLDGRLSGPLGAPDTVASLSWPVGATMEPPTQPTYYVVQSGDTLFEIAQRFNTDMDVLLRANQLNDANVILVGTPLAIPGSDGALPARLPITASTNLTEPVPALADRGTIIERMTSAAQNVPRTSPYYKTTWVTYYGRPDVPVMGILGEHDLDKLTTLLKQQAAAYDQANGNELGVMPAFHLVYGMATKAPGDDNSHLAFLADEVVEAYIKRAEKEKFAVILDIQIGGLTPEESIKPGLPWLKYKNVHLAIDPEFAMAHAGQAWPGDPIGFVTAQQVNAVQAIMQNYMSAEKIEGPRILLLHQFLEEMIVDKDQLKNDYTSIELTVVADGWGGPWGKISKYNAFMDPQATKFTAFKLFYRWDEPILNEREALGVDPYAGETYMDVTPNLIIYQ